MTTERRVVELEVQAGQAVAAMNQFANATGQAADAADELSRSSTHQAEAIERSAREVRKAQCDYETLQLRLDPIAHAQAIATRELEKYGNAMRVVGVPVAEQSRLLQGLTVHHERHISSLRNMGGAADAAGAKGVRFGSAMQAVGYQVSDLATQVMMGGNALQALAVQGGQLAGAFGPTGVAIGAVVTILGVAGAVVAKFVGDTQSAEEAAKKFEATLDLARGTVERFNAAVDRANFAPEGWRQERDAVADLRAEIGSLELELERLQRHPSFFNRGDIDRINELMVKLPQLRGALSGMQDAAQRTAILRGDEIYRQVTGTPTDLERQRADVLRGVEAAGQRGDTAALERLTVAYAAVNAALASFASAGEKAEATARAQAAAANMDAKGRAEWLAVENARIGMLGQAVTAEERARQIEAARTAVQAQRTQATRDAIDTAKIDADTSANVAAAYGRSAEAGTRAAAVEAALAQARRGQIDATAVEQVALLNLTKALNDNLSVRSREQSLYAAEEAGARKVAEAALTGAAADHKAADEAKIAAKYADDLAKARALGGDAAKAAVAKVESLADADRNHLAVMRSLNAEAEVNRQLRQGRQDIALDQREVEMIRSGVRPDERERELTYQRERQRIVEQTADIEDASVRNQKIAELDAQARLKGDQAAARKFWAETENFIRDISTSLSTSVADALLEGGKDGGEQLKRALARTVLSVPVNLAVQSIVTPFLAPATVQLECAA